jgi:L-ascorbate metabolism protein UlaG (beta-lactamase superfamily)
LDTTTFGSVDVEWLGHASVKLIDSDGLVVYIDPWSEVMKDEYEKADVIISTHDHSDHFDKKMIQALKKQSTILVCTEESEDEVPQDMTYKVLKPDSSVKVKHMRFRGVPAYNVDKFRETGQPFHPEGFCTGVIFEMDGTKFYHASDTDPIQEMKDLPSDIDVAFLPVGGHYTMDQDEAVKAVKMFHPKNVVPIHYGYIDETTADPKRFKEDVEEETSSEVVVLES